MSTLAPPASPLRPMSRITGLAAFHPFGYSPMESLVSLPIPCPGAGGLVVRFFYCAVESLDDPRGRWVRAPGYVSTVDAETAHLGELRRVTPREIGVDLDESALVCSYDAAAAALGTTERGSVDRACDVVTPAFCVRSLVPPADVRRAAKEILSALGALPPALSQAHRSVGSAFFDWLSIIAR